MSKWLQPRTLLLLLGALLIVAGAIYAFRYAKRSLAAYRALEFARQHDFAAGNLDVDLIRDWMSIRYIAVAYAVPQSYLFEQIGIPMTPPNSALPLERLNHHLGLGTSDGQPALLAIIRTAIERYRQDPVVTGLQEQRVHPWMSVQYIAASTGIPAQYIFEQLDIAPDGRAFLPLDSLSREIHYQPGLRDLIERVQEIVDTYEGPPP